MEGGNEETREENLYPQVNCSDTPVTTGVFSRLCSRFGREGLFDVPRSFRDASVMARGEAEKMRARGYVLRKLQEKGWDEARLVKETKLDRGTVRTFLAGATFPQKAGRNAIEDALGVHRGMLEQVAAGMDEEGPLDPVERAVQSSALSRGAKARVLGLYFDLLDGQRTEDAG
jgi:hypothetical protein